MFGIGEKRKANKLLNTINEFSSILTQQKEVFPNNDGDIAEVECLLTAISCFLASGFGNDDSLAYELVPAYQKRIMPYVSKQEYDRKTQLLQSYYLEYRDIAIEYQEGQKDWFMPLIDKYSHMMAQHLSINDLSPKGYGILGGCVVELINRINPRLHI